MYYPLDIVKGNAILKGDMILDAITLDNLNLLGGIGTLQKTLDYCSTDFGKR